ncbi:hypothetical protein MBM09_04350 [Flaviramulus sp. BrNp1-15]|uniref:hypothetical protein n=1 Tax=Flaviramulus sp. BrNp1-15 TaxID=2916754 RepID=UPI001EE8C16A|nr:hypothetical protein [Flaviramulus sp. BrNp1-15]ULC60223.1 hypothetical protein MBM09_04350 [Flaviramulus sp. BrNp1-15]
MKKIAIILTVMFSIALFTNCEENDDTPAITGIDFVGFESDFQIGVDPTGNASQEVKVAISQSSGSDRTFNLSVNTDLTTADASAYSIPSSVTIPANSTVGSFLVDVVGSNVNPSGADVLVIELSSEAEGLFKSDPITLNLKQVCPYDEVIISFTFDAYPEEAYWQLYDSNDVFLEGDGYEGSDCYVELSTSVKTFCLPSGDYQFLMGDCYGDGGTGYTITYGDTVLYSSAGVSDSGEVITFSLQ